MGRFLSKMINLRKMERLNPVISEIKVHSPKHGDLLRGRNIMEILETYERCKSAGISYITEKNHFRGDFKIFREICRESVLPVLRKDFIVTREEIERTAEADGNAVLLIARILKENTTEFVDFSLEHGIESVVEVHSIDDINFALESRTPIIGINNRDIAVLEKDDGSVDVTANLAPLIKSKAVKISESGIRSREDVDLALRYADAVLVGTAFMMADNIEKKVLEFVGDGNA